MPEATPKQAFEQIATGAALVATTPAAVTLAIRCANFTSIYLSTDYTRNGASITGVPIIAVDVSRDAPNTAAGSVAHWQPVGYTADGSTYIAGRLTAGESSWLLGPTATGTTTFGIPQPVDVTAFFWFRVLMADFDTVNRGTVDVYFGGV